MLAGKQEGKFVMGKVHFAEGQSPQPLPLLCSEVVEVKLGFLSCGGIYTTPITTCREGSSPLISGIEVSNLSTEWQAGVQPVLMLRFLADRPGPYEAQFALRFPEQHEAVRVVVSATVMPRNKGTPGLKPSVHCLGFVTETDTEPASDWHGFD